LTARITAFKTSLRGSAHAGRLFEEIDHHAQGLHATVHAARTRLAGSTAALALRRVAPQRRLRLRSRAGGGVRPDRAGRRHGAGHFADWEATTDGAERLDPVQSQYRETIVVLELVRPDGSVANFRPLIFGAELVGGRRVEPALASGAPHPFDEPIACHRSCGRRSNKPIRWMRVSSLVYFA
jgi:hypothetical protein